MNKPSRYNVLSRADEVTERLKVSLSGFMPSCYFHDTAFYTFRAKNIRKITNEEFERFISDHALLCRSVVYLNKSWNAAWWDEFFHYGRLFLVP